jgi:hypothetical protein
VFAARNVSVDELAQQAQLIRFAQLTLMTAGALRTAALRLERRPQPASLRHRLDDLDDGITRLLACEHRTIVNPYMNRSARRCSCE